MSTETLSRTVHESVEAQGDGPLAQRAGWVAASTFRDPLRTTLQRPSQMAVLHARGRRFHGHGQIADGYVATVGTSQIITVMFTDLVGSTEILTRLGPTRASSLRREHDRCVSTSVARHRGRVVKSTGDGIFAVFDSATAAVDAALDSHTAIRRCDQRWPDARISIRVGLSLGEATEEDGDWFGQTVVEAARLCDLATGDQTLATAIVGQLASATKAARFADLEPKDLKGIGPVATCEVTGAQQTIAGPPLPAAITQLLDPVFVGRDRELASIASLRDDSESRQRRVAVIAGEAGIGKSRLAAEAAFEASARGWRVLSGRCERDMGVPFAPFLEAIGPVIAELDDDRLRRHLREHGPDLVALFPSLARLVTSDMGIVAEQDLARSRLFGSVAAILQSLVSSDPVMLVIEDLHWAHPNTLKLVAHLTRASEIGPTLMVLTLRDTDIEAGSDAEGLIGEIGGASGVHHVALDGLDAGASAVVVDAVTEAAHGLRSETHESVFENSRGNPLFVLHMARHLEEIDQDRHSGSSGSVGAGLAETTVPTGIRGLVTSRLARFDRDTVGALKDAAVLGIDFSLDSAAAAADSDAATLADRFEPVVRAGLLLERSDLIDQFEFTHPVVRSALIRDLSTSKRARVHRRITVHMVGTGRTNDDHLIALAWHACRSIAVGTSARDCVRWSVDAADLTIGRLAPEEALVILEMAESALSSVGSPEPELQFELASAAVRAQNRLLDTEHIRDATLRAMDLAIESGHPEWADEIQSLAALGQQNTEDPELFDRFHQILELLGDERSSTRARVLSALGWREIIRGRPEAAEPIAELAQSIASAVDDPSVLAGTTLVYGLSLLRPETLDSSISALEEARLAASTVHDAETTHFRLSATRFLGIAHLIAGDRSHLDDHLEEVAAESDRVGSKISQAHCRQLQGMMALLAGDLDEAERAGVSLLAVADNEPNYQLSYAAQLQVIRREQDRSAELVPMVSAVVEIAPDMVLPPAVLSQMLLESGETEKGIELFASVMEKLAHEPLHDWLGPSVACVLAEVAAELGDVGAAQSVVPMLDPYAGLLALAPSGVLCLGAADRYRGQLQLTLGNTRDAEELLRSALETESAVGAEACRARTLMCLARTLLIIGGDDRRSEAISMLHTTRQDATRMGLARIESDIEAVLTSISVEDDLRTVSSVSPPF